jgi:hypothetical protein
LQAAPACAGYNLIENTPKCLDQEVAETRFSALVCSPNLNFKHSSFNKASIGILLTQTTFARIVLVKHAILDLGNTCQLWSLLLFLYYFCLIALLVFQLRLTPFPQDQGFVVNFFFKKRGSVVAAAATSSTTAPYTA